MSLSKVPSVVQLPGGIKLQAVAFRVVECADDGSPKLFELLPKGARPGPGVWFLFADESAIRTPIQK